MSRLLFAAARGARVQLNIGNDEWEEDRSAMVWELARYHADYRIYPDDAHLAYGPISAAPLEMAASTEKPTEYTVGAYVMVRHIEPNWTCYSDLSHRSLFLLILAEALADEGL